MPHLEYPVIVEPLPVAEGGGFVAIVPDLPGCLSDGETPEEALANVRDAIAAWKGGGAGYGPADSEAVAPSGPRVTTHSDTGFSAQGNPRAPVDLSVLKALPAIVWQLL